MFFDGIICTRRELFNPHREIVEPEFAILNPAANLLYRHDRGAVVGRLWEVLEHSAERITARFQVNDADGFWEEKAHKLLATGKAALSIGIRWLDDDDMCVKEPLEGGGLRLSYFDIDEVSLVTEGADPDCLVTKCYDTMPPRAPALIRKSSPSFGGALWPYVDDPTADSYGRMRRK